MYECWPEKAPYNNIYNYIWDTHQQKVKYEGHRCWQREDIHHAKQYISIDTAAICFYFSAKEDK